jgi:EAL domain-containing protein (putative c-di-GMP-specific phosphodiesterase class I)
VDLGCPPELRVTPSIGVCLSPEHGDDLDTLMRHADLAMYRAKALGRHQLTWFQAELHTQVRTRLALESELRQALAREEFELFYQPRICVATGRIVGAEALVRWHHPERGLVAPAAFIPACEDMGLIGALGARVLREAARQQVAWRAQGLLLNVSVNLSPRQFVDSNLAASVAAVVKETGCDPTTMELEITESVVLGQDGATLETLHALRALGFRISIDDFGTGYSNLAYLRRYPVDVLKIDRAFVSEIHESQPITGLILGMSRALGLRVVAEGVETDAQLAWLRAQGCDEFQGQLVSMPLPAPAFEALVRAAWGNKAQAPLELVSRA